MIVDRFSFLASSGAADSIEQTEEPERDFVAAADLDIVRRYIALRDLFDLAEALPFSPNFKGVLSIDDKISSRRNFDPVTQRKLVGEEGFPDRPFFGFVAVGIKQIAVVEIDLGRFVELFEPFCVTLDQEQQLPLLEIADIVVELDPADLCQCGNSGKVDLERFAFADHLQEFFELVGVLLFDIP